MNILGEWWLSEFPDTKAAGSLRTEGSELVLEFSDAGLAVPPGSYGKSLTFHGSANQNSFTLHDALADPGPALKSGSLANLNRVVIDRMTTGGHIGDMQEQQVTKVSLTIPILGDFFARKSFNILNHPSSGAPIDANLHIMHINLPTPIKGNYKGAHVSISKNLSVESNSRDEFHVTSEETLNIEFTEMVTLRALENSYMDPLLELLSLLIDAPARISQMMFQVSSEDSEWLIHKYKDVYSHQPAAEDEPLSPPVNPDFINFEQTLSLWEGMRESIPHCIKFLAEAQESRLNTSIDIRAGVSTFEELYRLTNGVESEPLSADLVEAKEKALSLLDKNSLAHQRMSNCLGTLSNVGLSRKRNHILSNLSGHVELFIRDLKLWSKNAGKARNAGSHAVSSDPLDEAQRLELSLTLPIVVTLSLLKELNLLENNEEIEYLRSNWFKFYIQAESLKSS